MSEHAYDAAFLQRPPQLSTQQPSPDGGYVGNGAQEPDAPGKKVHARADFAITTSDTEHYSPPRAWCVTNATARRKGRCHRSSRSRVKLGTVVIFFELLLVLAAIAIIAFSLYVVYRLVNDES